MHDQDIVLIPLRARDRKTIRAYAIIDAADAAWVNQWRWYLSADGYVMRTTSANKVRRHFALHRELLGLTLGDGVEGDHRDRNRLNNRRSNLRPLAKSGNRQNRSSNRASTSSFRGVSWDSKYNRWKAQISVNGKNLHVGSFTDEGRAAEAARNARARLLQFAVD